IWEFGKMVPQLPGVGVPPPMTEVSSTLAAGLSTAPQRFCSTWATVGVCSVPVKAPSAEKSPDCSAVVGTGTGFEEMPRLIRRPSYDVKKKVLSRLIGPPNVP